MNSKELYGILRITRNDIADTLKNNGILQTTITNHIHEIDYCVSHSAKLKVIWEYLFPNSNISEAHFKTLLYRARRKANNFSLVEQSAVEINYKNELIQEKLGEATKLQQDFFTNFENSINGLNSVSNEVLDNFQKHSNISIENIKTKLEKSLERLYQAQEETDHCLTQVTEKLPKLNAQLSENLEIIKNERTSIKNDLNALSGKRWAIVFVVFSMLLNIALVVGLLYQSTQKSDVQNRYAIGLYKGFEAVKAQYPKQGDKIQALIIENMDKELNR